MRFVFAAIASMCVLLAGCGSTKVERGQAIAVTGKSYVEVVQKVDAVAVDRSIRFTAGLMPELPRTSDEFGLRTEEMQSRVKQSLQLQPWFDSLAAYFTALEELTKGDQSEATEKSLASIAGSLASKPISANISPDKQKDFASLGGLVAKQIHAAKVSKALSRDAALIAMQIELCSQLVQEQGRWLRARTDVQRLRTRAELAKAFTTPKEKLGDDWQQRWVAYVSVDPVQKMVDDVTRASEKMQEAWKSILRAEYSFAEVQASIATAKTSVDAVAGKEK